MNFKEFFIYLFLMAGSTYLIRVIPFILIKKKIQNKFIKSFLYYVPYTVLAVMTIPSALLLTNHIWTALIGLCVAAMLALKGKSLTIVAVAASVVTLIAESLLLLF